MALVCVACACGDRAERARATDAPSSARSRGPDPIVLRAPRDGGKVRAYVYPRLDSLIWSSASATPALSRILAFDQEAGSLAYIGRDGLPGRLELRSGDAGPAVKVRFASLSSSDGWAIFGVAANGDSVMRLTPSGSWSFSPKEQVEAAIPQRDGSLVLVTDGRGGTRVLRLRPPEEQITESVTLPHLARVEPTQVGDRIYFRVDSGLIGVRTRDLTRVPAVAFSAPIRDLVPTPSADRIFVAVRGDAKWWRRSRSPASPPRSAWIRSAAICSRGPPAATPPGSSRSAPIACSGACARNGAPTCRWSSPTGRSRSPRATT
jgi:hypothetical protein